LHPFVVSAPNARGRLRSALRPLPVLIGWLVLISAWGLLGAQLDVNGPTRPPTAPFFTFAALFIASVVAAVPIGFVRRAHRALELLLWGAIAAVALEFWYVVMMFASTDPASDDTAAVGAMLSAVPSGGCCYCCCWRDGGSATWDCAARPAVRSGRPERPFRATKVPPGERTPPVPSRRLRGSLCHTRVCV
jgi:hypothetical protein